MAGQESREYLKKSLIAGRVFLVGEGKIPREVLESLSDEHMNVFLREPDPGKWPEAMRFLAQYLSEEERIQSKLSCIFSKHNTMMRDSIHRWVFMIREELATEEGILTGQEDYIMEQIGRYITHLVRECLDNCTENM